MPLDVPLDLETGFAVLLPLLIGAAYFIRVSRLAETARAGPHAPASPASSAALLWS